MHNVIEDSCKSGFVGGSIKQCTQKVRRHASDQTSVLIPFCVRRKTLLSFSYSIKFFFFTHIKFCRKEDSGSACKMYQGGGCVVSTNKSNRDVGQLLTVK